MPVLIKKKNFISQIKMLAYIFDNFFPLNQTFSFTSLNFVLYFSTLFFFSKKEELLSDIDLTSSKPLIYFNFLSLLITTKDFFKKH